MVFIVPKNKEPVSMTASYIVLHQTITTIYLSITRK